MKGAKAISRRALLAGLVLANPALLSLKAKADDAKSLKQKIDELERMSGGHLGVAVLDTGNNKLISHRGDERFALCSTFKLLAAAFVLSRVDRGQESFARRVMYGKADLIAYSPMTEKHVGEGLTVGELCEAAMTLSDNTAANLLLDSFGGPAVLTAYARSLGDDVTRLDRREPEMSRVEPGDARDTTSPVAMLETMQKLCLGTALSDASRSQLIAWLVANKTGDARLRKGLSGDWRVGDKTGSGVHNETNDIAILWPPGRAPVIVTAYYAGSDAADDTRNAVLAEVGRLVSIFASPMRAMESHI